MNNSIRGRDKFYKFKKYIIILSKIYCIFPLSIRKKIFEFHRMTKGKKGIILRYALLKSIALKCGDNVSIYPGAYILSPEKITFGNNVSIHPMCYLDGTGEICIGNDVSIAHGTSILSTTHKYESIDIAIKDQGIELLKTIVNSNVWIGAKATILGGIVIESGSIIAANAVVTKNIFRNTIVAGVPATIVKKRN